MVGCSQPQAGAPSHDDVVHHSSCNRCQEDLGLEPLLEGRPAREPGRWRLHCRHSGSVLGLGNVARAGRVALGCSALGGWMILTSFRWPRRSQLLGLPSQRMDHVGSCDSAFDFTDSAMSHTIDSVLLDNRHVAQPLRLIGEYRFLIGELDTRITVRLYQPVGADRIEFSLSHFIHTPVQAGPYCPSCSSGDYEAYALNQASPKRGVGPFRGCMLAKCLATSRIRLRPAFRQHDPNPSPSSGLWTLWGRAHEAIVSPGIPSARLHKSTARRPFGDPHLV